MDARDPGVKKGGGSVHANQGTSKRPAREGEREPGVREAHTNRGTSKREGSTMGDNDDGRRRRGQQGGRRWQ